MWSLLDFDPEEARPLTMDDVGIPSPILGQSPLVDLF